ncbi:hypothetical protein LTR62_004829 [Meristemomyces frigidus]|uniref:Uncharacterized protein n=1 Tax=Meristemomyces frigidus TaxID=1508187 RepID=A0AAN7TH77_9PEZI|nr:hypothetical protein LTR62_004829 [Meristemomyces frigidus]
MTDRSNKYQKFPQGLVREDHLDQWPSHTFRPEHQSGGYMWYKPTTAVVRTTPGPAYELDGDFNWVPARPRPKHTDEVDEAEPTAEESVANDDTTTRACSQRDDNRFAWSRESRAVLLFVGQEYDGLSGATLKDSMARVLSVVCRGSSSKVGNRTTGGISAAAIAGQYGHRSSTIPSRKAQWDEARAFAATEDGKALHETVKAAMLQLDAVQEASEGGESDVGSDGGNENEGMASEFGDDEA